MSDRPSVFDQAVAASRLNRLVAPFTMSRLLVRAGVLPQSLTPEDLARAIPVLADGLRVYLDEQEHARALHDLTAIAAQRVDTTTTDRR